jgi:hypothetical protein
VSATDVVLRSNRGLPRVRSRARMLAETVDWTAWVRLAARVKLSSSATAMKNSS